ncbi:MAG: adenylyltransferase/cytidyltransferase family protein, partial [Candidatus Omnitrophica bacterium]|nr:adenylyltransferase/cytidyltransferase family protein [Candidatus Omnitrophota bacterium]
MKIIKGLKHLKRQPEGSVVTIGVFDGLHIGHRHVIEKAVRAAKESNRLASVAVTFDPHPVKVLSPGRYIPSLISLKHRIRLIEEIGADKLVIVKFTKSFSKMPPEKFVKNILIGKLRMKHIFVGENFYFGRGAGAGTELLRKLSRKYGFGITAVKPVKVSGRIANSSLTRDLISKGKLREAARLLGRPVSVLGTVVKGSGIARGLG